MNGTISHGTGKDDPFTNLLLSLDATTLDQALGKRRVKATEQDGSVTYEEAKEHNLALTEQLERIWNEYPNGLLDVTEDQLSRLAPEEDAIKVDEAVKDEGDNRDPSKPMTAEDMEKLRSEVYLELNDARNELWFVLELVKTLAVSQPFTNQPPVEANQLPAQQKKGKPKPPTKAAENPLQALPSQTEPPVLPPGTYSTTSSAAPVKPTHAQVHDIEMVLAAKQQALDECSALIDSAVSELQLMASAGDRFWRDVRRLKDGDNGRGQWALVPKPDFGRTGEEKSKDIIIPYAVDEASRATRARCLAAFDLDPRKKDALTFGARHHLRLRATLRDDAGTVVRSTPVEPERGSEVRSMMEAAQMEAFDEDLFNEVRVEASRIDRSEIEPGAVTIPAAEYHLTFELYDPRNTSITSTSPLCDLVLSAARLGLLNVLRQRKANLVAPSSSYAASIPSILQPIDSVLRYRQLCAVVQSTLENFTNTLRSAGIEAAVDSRPLQDKSQEIGLEALLLAEAETSFLSGSHSLHVAECDGAVIGTTAPSRATVILTHAIFPLATPEDLSHVLSGDLSTQLTGWVYRQLCSSLLPKHRPIVFLDELEGVIDLASMGQLSISIPPPYHTVFGHVQPPDGPNNDISDDEGLWKIFDGRAGKSLKEWTDRLAERIAGIDTAS